MAVTYTVNGGSAIRSYHMDTGDPLPFNADGVPGGSSLMLNDNQNAGVMFFSSAQDCWFDENGKKWTKEAATWTPTL